MEKIILAEGLTTTDGGHVIVFGSDGSGKTGRFVLLNLLGTTGSIIVASKASDRLSEKVEECRQRDRFLMWSAENWNTAVPSSAPFVTYISLQTPYSAEGISQKISEIESVLRTVLELEMPFPLTVFIDNIDMFYISRQLLNDVLSRGREKRLRIVITVLNLSTLQAEYGRDGADEIISHCAYKVIMGSCDDATGAWVEFMSEGAINKSGVIGLDLRKCIVLAYNSCMIADKIKTAD